MEDLLNLDMDKLDSDVEIIVRHKKGEPKGETHIEGKPVAILNAFYTLCQNLVKNEHFNKHMLIALITILVKDEEE